MKHSVEPERLARQWGMSLAEVEAWLGVEPLAWVLSNARLLYAAGLSAGDAARLYQRLDPQARACAGRLVYAGRVASLEVAHLHLWAAAGLLKPAAAGKGGGEVFTAWVTAARQYIAAAGGDQRLAALAAAAGLSVEETAAGCAAGQLDAEALEALAALTRAPGDPSEGVAGGWSRL